jgi:hypothetical protein
MRAAACARVRGWGLGGVLSLSLCLVWVLSCSLGVLGVFGLFSAVRPSVALDALPVRPLALGCLVQVLGGGALAVLWRDPVGAAARSVVGWCAGAFVVRSSLCGPVLSVVQMDKR